MTRISNAAHYSSKHMTGPKWACQFLTKTIVLFLSKPRISQPQSYDIELVASDTICK